jgi:hypothetical protein
MGYEDPEYPKYCKDHIKFRPVDETITFLLNDIPTADWNPIIYAIFY